MERLMVVVIVLVAAYFLVRRLCRALSGRSDMPCCDCRSCCEDGDGPDRDGPECGASSSVRQPSGVDPAAPSH